MSTERRCQVKRARQPYQCRASHWAPGVGHRPARAWDGGPLPADHTADIAPGSIYVQWQQYGETQRMCEACAIAAGLITPEPVA